MTTAEVTSHQDRVVGLRLPNGTEIWPDSPTNTWHGHPIATPEDRQNILSAIGVSEDNLGYGAGHLASGYHWLVRIDRSYQFKVRGEVEIYPLNTGALLQGPTPDPEPESEPEEPVEN